MALISASRVRRFLSGLVPTFWSLVLLLSLFSATLLFIAYPRLQNYIPHTVAHYLKLGHKPEIDWYTTRFLDERLPVRPAPQVVKWNITLCAVVHNEAAYLLEWIEYHRRQGVSHFVLYDYRSTDLLVYYPMFYEDNHLTDLIDIIPAKFVPRELRDEKNYKKDRRQNRHYAMIDCYMRHRNLTQWIVMMDVSQFLFSSTHNSTWSYVKALQEREIREGRDLLLIAPPAVMYGPATNISAVFDTWMTPNSQTGGVDLLYEPVPGTFDTYPLLVETNPSRAPHPDLDANFQPCKTDDGGCDQWDKLVPPVVFVRNTRCKVNNVTDCIFNAPDKKDIPIPDNAVRPTVQDLRVKAYPWRPRNLSPPHDSLPVELPDLTKVPAWYSTILDETVPKMTNVLRNRLARIKPLRVFRNVGRDCVEEALKTHQQMKCPATHPYPFGEVGVNFLRDCCATDKDKDGKPLQINSTSCEGGKNVYCTDPVSMKDAWIHRSCCINTAAVEASRR